MIWVGDRPGVDRCARRWYGVRAGVRREADQESRRREGDADAAFDQTRQSRGLIQFVSSAGETLRQQEKPIANTNAPISANGSVPRTRLPRPRGHRERAETEGDAIASDSPGHDAGQAGAAGRGECRVVRDLRDAPVGTAHRHGPARGSAHHHALEHRLTTIVAIRRRSLRHAVPAASAAASALGGGGA